MRLLFANKKYVFIFIFILSGHPALFAGDDEKKVFSLDDYIQNALKYNPVVSQAVETREASSNLVKKEKTLPSNPVLSVSYQNVPINTFPALDQHPMSSVTLSVSQTLPTPGEALYRNQSAYWQYLSDSYRYWEVRNMIVLQVKSLYHELFYLHTNKAILQESDAALRSIVSVARALVSVNKMNASHLLKLEGDLAVLKNRQIELDSALEWYAARLEEVSRLAAPVFNEVYLKNHPWMMPGTSIVLPQEFNFRRHPLYLGVQAALSKALAQVEYEKNKAMPGVTLSASYSYRSGTVGGDPGDDFISLKISAPIPAYQPVKEANAVKAAGHKADEIRAKLQEIENALTAGWSGESKKAKLLLEAYRGYQEDVIPRYFISYNALLSSFSAGTVGLLDVLDSYRLYLNALMAQAEIYRKLQMSISVLEYYGASAENLVSVEEKNEKK